MWSFLSLHPHSVTPPLPSFLSLIKERSHSSEERHLGLGPLYHSTSLSLYHSLFGSAVPYTHSGVGLNIKFKEVMQTRRNSHPWPKYYPQPFNYPPCFPLSPFLLPFLSSVRVLSLRSSNCSLEIQRTLMTWGQKDLKYQGHRVQHSGGLLHTRTHKMCTQNTHVYTQTDERRVQQTEGASTPGVFSVFQM